MFTGLVECVGRVMSVEQRGCDRRLTVAMPGLAGDALALGESIAVNGVCLTVTARDAQGFCVDVSAETLSCTTCGALGPDDPVNLERAVTPATRLGGHLVSGHVDGVGTVRSLVPEGSSRRLAIEVPEALTRYIAVKGSICLDGVSLTVNAVPAAGFEVNIIPHTWENTVIQNYRVGQPVNIEVDVVARYVERFLTATAGRSSDAGVTADLLRRQGYLNDE